jgi:hypothetical protein
MQMRLLFIFLLLAALIGCENNSVSSFLVQTTSTETVTKSQIDSIGMTIQSRFRTPEGFERAQLDSNSFGFYLRNFLLHPINRIVHYFDGREKTKQDVYCSVLKQEIDPVDLQQCADAVMRLRGEFLFQQKRFNDIHFNFVSDGKPHYFKEYANGDYSYKKFRSYMKYIFSYANTGSLKKELVPVASINEIEVGDVFIQSGNPYGHAVIVMDVVISPEGNKRFLLAQSYMPAQETQVLINPIEEKLSPWFDAKEGEIITPEWKFNSSDLRRFEIN